MSDFLLVVLIITYYSSVSTSVLGQCPLQCSCSVVHNVSCISSSLTELPPLQFNKKITKLNASFNNITVLNKNCLKDIPMLAYLILSHNKITIVNSQAFLTLKKLCFLDLSSNNITSIESGTFMYNKQLKWLSLAENLMFTLPENEGLYLTQLSFWNISHCNIKNIHLNAFRNAQELQELYLNNNKIVSLNPNVYRPLLRLQKLDLCYNALQTIDGQVFSRLFNLISLSMCHNNISRISFTLLNAVVKIGYVNLEGNPWICDCDSADVYRKCAKEDYCDLNLKCAFPDHFKDRHWNVTGQLECMPTVSSMILGTLSEAEAVSTMREITTEQILQEDSSEQNNLNWITISVLFIISIISLVGIEILWIRICKERKKYVKETDGESCSSGGFSARFLNNEDSFQHAEIR